MPVIGTHLGYNPNGQIIVKEDNNGHEYDIFGGGYIDNIDFEQDIRQNAAEQKIQKAKNKIIETIKN